MKLRKGTLLFILLTCLAYTTLAQTNYTLKYEDVTINNDRFITACSCSFSTNTGGTNLTIPKSVTKGTETIIIKGIAGKFPGIFQDKKLVSVKFVGDSEVTTIGAYAFYQNNITTLTLPKGLTTIEFSAFYENNITTLTLPPSLETIGEKAFYENNIKTLTLPEGLTTIGGNAFYNNQIATLTLPTTLTTIGGNAFSRNEITELTFPEGSQLETIAKDAFEGNPIVTLTLPKGLTTIGESAFQNNKITELTFPDDSQLTSIGKFAFFKNPSLPSFTLPSVAIEGYRAYWKDGNSEDLGNSPTILNANFEKSFELDSIEQFTLTTAVEGQQGGTITPSVEPNNDKGEYDINTEVSLTATPDQGWRFDKWVIDTNESTDNPTDDISMDTDKSATAHFVQVATLTTSVEGQQGGSISQSPDMDTYDINTEVTLTATPTEGWRFDKWVIGTEESTDKTTTITLNQDKTVTAHFVQLVTLTVKVNNEEGGSIEPSDDHFVIDKADAPSTQALTAKPNEGWRFDKWVIGSDEITNNPTSINLDQDKTVTAHFVEIVTLTVEVNNEEGGSIAPSDDRFVIDKADAPSTQELTATPNEGWRFDKWVIGSEERTDKTTTITLNQDKTVTAHFVQLVTLTTAVAEQQGGTIAQSVKPNNDGEYDIKTEVTLTATPADGWKFDKWVIGTEERTDNPTSINLDGNKSATAHFVQLVTLTTSVEGQQGGSISRSPDMDTYNINTEVSLTATPADGWKFDKWVIGTEERTDNPTNINLDGNKSATAHFVEIVTLTVEVNNEEGGSIEPSDDHFVIDKADAPSTQALTAKPNDGWRFDKWVIGSEDITDNPTTITLDQDKTATAHFVEIVTLTVEVNNEDGGSIEPSDDHFVIDKADPPSTQELTATPNDGWRFDKWVIGTDEITENPTTITLDKNKSVTAHFVKEEEEEAITSILTEVVSATPYPNPVTSQITLKAKDGDLIQLLSQKGKQQYSAQHTGNEVHIIDVSTLPVGVYLVRITDAEGNTTTKRIVKK